MTSELVQIGGRASYYDARSALLDATYARTWASLKPMFAHVYVENRCHLKCDHCYESEASHPHDHHLTLEDYGRVFDELAGLGVLVLTLSGGEPFLRKDFLDIVELARSKRFAVRIYTSGTPITVAKADRLAELKVSEVHVSVYSSDAARHDTFTGQKGSHALSVRALRLLAERGVRTVLKSNIFKWNLDEVDDLIGLAEALGAEYSLDPTVKPRMDGDRTPLEHALSPEQIRDLLLERPHLSPAPDETRAESICHGDNARDAGGGLCSAARGAVTIWADGSVAPCSVFPVAGGNVLEERLTDIWLRSPLFDKVRRTQMSDMKSCGSCDVRGGCTPCMAYGVVEHDDHLACSSPARQFAEAHDGIAKHVVKVARGEATMPEARPAPRTRGVVTSEL